MSFAPIAIADIASTKNTLSTLTINENTDPAIKKLYEELSESVAAHDELSRNYQSDLQDNATAMKDKEQSTANKVLGGATIAATGIGGMQLASGLAEKSADESAARDMDAYISTFSCRIGDTGSQLAYGQTYEVPGYSAEFMSLAQQYRDLAAQTKSVKEALGLKPGIESEEIIDKSTLYSYESATERTNIFDTASERLESGGAANKVKTGAIVAGVGVVGGIVGNAVINKDAPKESSKQIKNQYEADSKKIESDLNNKEKQLQTAIAENEKKIQKYNDDLKQHQEFIKTISDSDCADKFAEYTTYINGLAPITDNLQNASNLNINHDINSQKTAYDKCVSDAVAARLEKEKQNCLSNTAKQWVDNKCIDRPVATRGSSSTATKQTTPVVAATVPVASEETPEEQVGGEGRCPAKNPRLSTLNENTKVGDACSYGNVAEGTVFKYTSGQYKDTCSCTATACKLGYKLEKGNCVEETADSAGNCLRKVWDETSENNSKDKCSTFCAAKAKDNKCTHVNSINTDKKCTCNPTQQEIMDIVAKSNAAAEQQKEEQIANLKYFELCGNDKAKVDNKNYFCIDDFKGRVITGIKVTQLQAEGLAKEYASVKNGHTIECSQTSRQANIDDYIKCSSLDGKSFYEFQFDSITTSVDSTIKASILNGVCNYIHGSKFTDSGCDANNNRGSYVNGRYVASSGGSTCWSARCESNQATCTKINKSLQRFGYGAKFASHSKVSGNTCVINSPSSSSALKTAFGVDNYAFYHGIQVRGSQQVISYLKQYVTESAKPTTITSFRCNDGPTQRYDFSGMVTESDDVLRCYANNQEIDFVFDDLSEAWKKYVSGGMQGMSCIVASGTYTGKQCIGLDEQQCINLGKANLTDCPGCKQAKWDKEKQSCILPSSASATNLQKGIRVGGIVVGVAAGAVLTVVSGGTATPVLVLVAVEAGGGAIEIVSEVKMNKVAQEFLTNSQKCKNATCAEGMVKDNLQRMSNLASRFTDAEINAIDTEMARLINLLPPESQIYQKTLAENSKGFFDSDSWEPEQVWQAVGLGLQLTGLVTAIGRNAVKKLGRATTAFKNGAKKAAQTVATKTDNAVSMTATQAKRLDEIDARLTRIKNTPNSSDEVTKLNYERNQIMNQVGTKDADVIAVAKSNAYDQKAITDAQKELSDAREALAKRMKWEEANPGAARNDLQSRSSYGHTARDNVTRAEQKLRDMGIDVPASTTSQTTPVTPARPAATTTPKPAVVTPVSVVDDAVKQADEVAVVAKMTDDVPVVKVADDAVDGAKLADDVPGSAVKPTDDAAKIKAEQDAAAKKLADEQAAKLKAEQDAAAKKLADEQAAKRLADEQAARAVTQKLDNMKSRTGLNDLNLVPATQNSAGVDQYRLLTQLEEEADDIVRNLNNRGIHAGKIKTGTGVNEKIYVAIVDDASDYAKLKPFVQPEKAIVAKIAPVVDNVVVASADNIANLRRSASSNFDKYLDDFKRTGDSVGLPKQRLSDDGWRALNDDLSTDNIRLFDDGDGYMRFGRTNSQPVIESAKLSDSVAGFSANAKRIVGEVDAIKSQKGKVVAFEKSYFDNLSGTEQSHINQMVRENGYAYVTKSQPDGGGGSYPTKILIFQKTDDMVDSGHSIIRRLTPKRIGNTRNAITTINGKGVFLETLESGQVVGNVSGRPVVVVNYDGHRIPFYASSGSAGKLDVPTGEWEVFFGFGTDGWFNKGSINSILNHYDSADLRKIANALNDIIGDQRNVEDVVSSYLRRSHGGIGNVASYDGPKVSSESINRMLDFTPIDYGAGSNRMYQNIEQVRNYFN